MSVKLTEIAEQRFVDNITSITPGALKGGVTALATHPKFEEIVDGGSDGLPRVYLIFREVRRQIGDDAQFIADLFPITGRVFSIRFSPDGTRIAYGGGLDRAGEMVVCSYDYTNEVPKELRDIMGKVPGLALPMNRSNSMTTRNRASMRLPVQPSRIQNFIPWRSGPMAKWLPPAVLTEWCACSTRPTAR